jgi:hypothetical protein
MVSENQQIFEKKGALHEWDAHYSQQQLSPIAG